MHPPKEPRPLDTEYYTSCGSLVAAQSTAATGFSAEQAASAVVDNQLMA